MAAAVTSGAAFQFSQPKALFDTHLQSVVNVGWDVSNDGRFLIPMPSRAKDIVPMNLVLNWQAGLKK